MKKPKARKSPNYQALVKEFHSKSDATYQKASLNGSINKFADKWDDKYSPAGRRKKRRRSPAPFGKIPSSLS